METNMPVLQTTPLHIKEITLWRREIATQSDALANAIRPLLAQGVELEVLLRYRHPTDKRRAFIEICPQAASAPAHLATILEAAGFTPRDIPALLIESDNFSDHHYSLPQMIASLDVNIMFLATHVTNGTSGATIGFETAADAQKAVDTFIRMTARSRSANNHRESSTTVYY